MSSTPLQQATTWAEAATLVLRTLAATRHHLDIYSPDLAPDLLNTDAAMAHLRRIAQSGRHARVRGLLHDAAAVAASDHRIVGLYQRLPSSVELRVVTERVDLSYNGAFIITDHNDCCRFTRAGSLPMTALTAAPGASAQWVDHFESAWLRASPARALRKLDL